MKSLPQYGNINYPTHEGSGGGVDLGNIFEKKSTVHSNNYGAGGGVIYIEN